MQQRPRTSLIIAKEESAEKGFVDAKAHLSLQHSLTDDKKQELINLE